MCYWSVTDLCMCGPWREKNGTWNSSSLDLKWWSVVSLISQYKKSLFVCLCVGEFAWWIISVDFPLLVLFILKSQSYLAYNCWNWHKSIKSKSFINQTFSFWNDCLRLYSFCTENLYIMNSNQGHWKKKLVFSTLTHTFDIPYTCKLFSVYIFVIWL